MITVTVDNRVRISKEDLAKLTREQVDQLKALGVHENPEFEKWQRYKKGPRPQAYIRTFKEDSRGLSLPKGCLDSVLQLSAFRPSNVSFKDIERRPEVDFQWNGPQLWDAQNRLVDSFADSKGSVWNRSGVWRSPPGCLSGDTVIGINRAGKSFNISLKDLVYCHNGGQRQGRRWDPNIPTQIRGRSLDGYVRLHTIQDAIYSGVKEVYEYRFSNGSVLRATQDHWVLAFERGEWVWREFGDLGKGSLVAAEGKSQLISKAKPRYKEEVNLRGHRYARKRANVTRGGNLRVATHRLVLEAHLNGLSLESYLDSLRKGESDFYFIPPEMEVHHIDEVSTNNELSNLALMTSEAHDLIHARFGGGWQHVNSSTVPVEIVDVQRIGEEPTYDLKIDAPNNFLANGIVVHNSGKTCATLYLVAYMQQKTLVVCPSEAVFKQWQDRSREWLGTEPGILKGSKRKIGDITIAMQQTLFNCAEEYASEFGFVIVDEGQKAASRTYQDVIDVFKAKYRLTVTGDERRADGKEFLIYDQFGSHVEEVTKAECLQAGTLVDTDIIVVETDFRFPDYVELPKEKLSQVKRRGGGPKEIGIALAQHRFQLRPKLDEALYKDQDRNALIVSIARRCLAEGQHVVCLSTRREHCLMLDAMLSAFAPTVRFMGDDEDFEQSRDRFSKGEVKCAVGTYKKIGVGFEACRELGRGILSIPFSVSGEGGRMEMAQFTGRFARAAQGKKNAKVYYLHDVHVFGDKPVKLFKSWYDRVHVLTLQGKMLPVREYLKRRQQKERNETKASDSTDDESELFQSGFKFD